MQTEHWNTEIVAIAKSFNELEARVSLLENAKRSEALQGCPPSATGSADARAADEAGADSSGRSADKAVQSLVEKWRANVAEWLDWASAHKSKNEALEAFVCTKIAESVSICAAELEQVRLTLAAQRERACLPNNDKL